MNCSAIKHGILISILLFLSFGVNALTLNPLIEAPDGHRIINQKPLLFNDQIIFITEHEDDFTLWSYDLTIDSYELLKKFDEFNPLQNFHIIGDYFYFRDNKESSQVWRSNGTENGTNPVSGFTMFKYSELEFFNNLLFAQTVDGNLDIHGFDGQNLRQYNIEYFPRETEVCAFSLNDVVIPSTNVSAGNQHFLKRYSDQNITDYTSQLPPNYNGYGVKVWQYNDMCFYRITAPEFYDILVIPENGDTFFLGERIEYSDISQIIRFKEDFFAIGRDTNGDNKLIKLSSDLNQVISEVESQNNLYFYEFRVSNDYLIVQEYSGGAASPPVFYTGYYNADLEKIEELGGYLRYLPEIYPTSQGETIYLKYHPVFGGDSQNILATDITNQADGLVIKGQVLVHVITNVNNPETYTLMRDLTSGHYTINHLQQLPDMGSLSVGAWFDPDYQSQGINIVDGVRDDGSRYLFVTLYLFRDGQPLWLSGVGEISYPQPTIDIELGEYSGLGLWQADTAANVEKFADMTLSMSGCHQMMMHLETVDNQTFNIELQRMANSEINLRCKD